MNDAVISRDFRSLTILQGAGVTHKPCSLVICLLFLAVTAFSATAWAQEPDNADGLQPIQLVSVGAGVLFYAVPDLAGINEHPASCAPCDPAGLPWYDRWAVRPQNGTLSQASTVVGLGMAAATLLDLERKGGAHAAFTSLEAVTWTAAITEWQSPSGPRRLLAERGLCCTRPTRLGRHSTSTASGPCRPATPRQRSHWPPAMHCTPGVEAEAGLQPLPQAPQPSL